MMGCQRQPTPYPVVCHANLVKGRSEGGSLAQRSAAIIGDRAMGRCPGCIVAAWFLGSSFLVSMIYMLYDGESWLCPGMVRASVIFNLWLLLINANHSHFAINTRPFGRGWVVPAMDFDRHSPLIHHDALQEMSPWENYLGFFALLGVPSIKEECPRTKYPATDGRWMLLMSSAFGAYLMTCSWANGNAAKGDAIMWERLSKPNASSGLVATIMVKNS